MTTSEHDLGALAVAALHTRPSPAESEARARPPYPTPAGWVPFQEAAFEALRERLERGGGDDPPMTTRLYEPARSLSAETRLLLTANAPFNLFDTVCCLLAGGLVSVEDVHAIAGVLPPGDSIAKFLQRAVVYRCVADRDLERAAAEAGSPWLGDTAWVGWRAIGEHHAAAGDAKAFFALWRHYKAGQKRLWMDRIRRELVLAVSREQGWRAAAELSTDRRLGPAYLTVALEPIAESGAVTELSGILDSAEEFRSVDELSRLSLLTTAVVATSDRDPAADHPHLAEVLDRLIAVDPTESKATMRHRDGLLARCWPAIGDEATLKRMRAALRTPSLRREFSVLPRDVRGPE